jgi:hypothetical protein
MTVLTMMMMLMLIMMIMRIMLVMMMTITMTALSLQRMNAPVPRAVTGGSDPVYLTVEYAIEPASRQLALHAKAFNAMNCKLEQLHLHLVIR